jgi:hypothetical protein
VRVRVDLAEHHRQAGGSGSHLVPPTG